MVKEKKDTEELLNELEQEMVRVEKEKVDLRNAKERRAPAPVMTTAASADRKSVV